MVLRWSCPLVTEKLIMHEFEKVIQEVGAFGPFQVRVFLLVSAFETPAAWAMLLPVFAAAKPTWRCPSGYHDNYTLHGNSSVSYPHGNDVTESIPNTSHTGQECTADGTLCPGVEFTSDFTSIATEVSFQFFFFFFFQWHIAIVSQGNFIWITINTKV